MIQPHIRFFINIWRWKEECQLPRVSRCYPHLMTLLMALIPSYPPPKLASMSRQLMSPQEFLSIFFGAVYDSCFSFCQILFSIQNLKDMGERWWLFSFYWFSANCASSDHPKFCNWLPKLFCWTFSVANFFKSWCYNKQIWRTGNLCGWKPLRFLDDVSHFRTQPFGSLEPFQLSDKRQQAREDLGHSNLREAWLEF